MRVLFACLLCFLFSFEILSLWYLLIFSCFIIFICLFVCLWREGFSMYPWPSWNSFYRPSCPQTQRFTCLSLPSAGITWMCHHSRLEIWFVHTGSQNILESWGRCGELGFLGPLLCKSLCRTNIRKNSTGISLRSKMGLLWAEDSKDRHAQKWGELIFTVHLVASVTG